MYKENEESNDIYILVAHPGGPYFSKKDNGWWSIPKGEPEPEEDIFQAALREFEEETGMSPCGPFIDLGSIIQKNEKEVFAWAFEGDWPNGRLLKCNEITIEYPHGSGRKFKFPEIDQVRFIPINAAKVKLRAEQVPLLDRLASKIKLIKKAKSC